VNHVTEASGTLVKESKDAASYNKRKAEKTKKYDCWDCEYFNHCGADSGCKLKKVPRC